MSENVISLKKENNQDANEKLESFMTRNRKAIIICFVALVAVAAVVCICFGVKSGSAKKNLAAIDSIEYAYTKDSGSLSDEEVLARQTETLENLKPYLSKKGSAGTRANMLAADIAFVQNDYENAVKYYLAGFSSNKNAYTAPLCKFNAGVCYEELEDFASAAKCYESASSFDDFLLKSHALFSLGRVKEVLGDADGAKEAYTKLTEGFKNDSWSDLAQSRLIYLETNVSAENK